MNRARERDIKFVKKKSHIKVTEVKYLGNIVSEHDFRPDPGKVRAIVDMPPPENKQDLRCLLGVVKYPSQYVPNMSEITATVRTLLKNDIKSSGHDEHQKLVKIIPNVLTRLGRKWDLGILDYEEDLPEQ